jgi:hypothetical protein
MKLQDYYNKCFICGYTDEDFKYSKNFKHLKHFCTFRLDKRYKIKMHISENYYCIDKHRTSKFIYRIVVSKFYNQKEFKIYKYNKPHLATIVDYKDFDLEFKDIYDLISYSDKILNSTLKNQIFI